ncbi:hypothetical protein D3C85_1934220 [compost metagenome]
MRNAVLVIATRGLTGQITQLLDTPGSSAIQPEGDGAGDENREVSSCSDVHGINL